MKTVYIQVRDEVRRHVYNQVNEQIHTQLQNQVRRQIYGKIGKKNYTQLSNKTYVSVSNQIYDQVWVHISKKMTRVYTLSKKSIVIKTKSAPTTTRRETITSVMGELFVGHGCAE